MEDFTKFLNPAYLQLDNITDTSEITPKNKLEEEEYPHLIHLITLIDEDLRKGLKYMQSLVEQIEHFIWVIDNETGDDKTDAIKMYNKLITEMEILVSRLDRSLETLDAPYFGKIIFDRKESIGLPKSLINVYIGKFGYFDKTTNKPMISDWRSPIANLYYKYSGPTSSVKFISPAGEQEGDIRQKRQFEIANGRFDHIYDIKSGNATADQFLLDQIGKRTGDKLQDIVSTIQEKQNEIIRDQIDKPMIIQGVAGSGKTTILLHRIAYLFYTYEEKIRPEKSLIIAPNNVFLDYISDVLPSLGVKGLKQDTYLFWARGVLGLSENYVMDSHQDLEITKIKGSVDFVETMKEYLDHFEDKFRNELPTSIGPDINEQYEIVKSKSDLMSMKEMVGLAIEGTFMQRSNISKGSLQQMKRYEGEKQRMETIKNYVKKVLRVYEIYKDLYNDKDFVPTRINKATWEKISKESLKLMKKQKGFNGYTLEDLAAMTLIHKKLYGYGEELMDQIIVDEAQDLSPIQLFSLANFANKGNITLAGDTAQSIIPPYHITDWNGVKKMLSDATGQDAIFHILTQSYRSTIEIISSANRILSNSFPKEYALPEAILRHGDEVLYYLAESNPKALMLASLEKIIATEIDKETPSIAVLTRNELQSDEIFAYLESRDLSIPYFSYKQENFHSGLQILPINYAKGLEFDSVVVWDISDENYSNDDDARLLYVAMTRALNRLHLVVNSESPSSMLPKELLKELSVSH